jgi:hypothetical protein
MPTFSVRIKLKTTGKGYVSSHFLLSNYKNIRYLLFVS